MNRILLGSALFFYAVITNASTDWQGSYVGITAGGDWGNANPKVSTVSNGSYLSAANAAAVNREGDRTISPTGFTAGIATGYNWLVNHTLFGLEADLQSVKFGDSSHSTSVTYPSTPSSNFVVGSYVNINWLATLRPRIGYLSDNKLFYLTGGLGVTNLHANFYFDDSGDALTSGSIDKTKFGYTLGCGAEMTITKAWRLKLEYLFVHFNKTDADKSSNSLLATYPNQRFNYSTDLNANFLQIGFIYS